jgi:galactokinase/mevalonate kinase-like predicted kinase
MRSPGKTVPRVANWWGVGDGGFFMLYCNGHDKTKLIEAMLRMDLR